MSQQKCRAAFANPQHDKICAGLFRATEDVCGCERYSMSDLSPGVVQDNELLNLILSDPNHVLDDGSINPAILIPLDTSGVSVLRNNAADAEFELTLIELKQRSAQNGMPRFFHGVCEFPASLVRRDGGTRLLGVYDTALPQKPHHADLVGPDLHPVTTASKTQREKENRKRAKRVVELIGDSLVRAQSFRNGAFAVHARP